MSRKRKTRRVSGVKRHRRKVSGIGDIDFTDIALTVAGAVAGRMLFSALTASTNSTMGTMAPYVGLIAGVALPMVSKAPMIKPLAAGLVASGGVNMLLGLKVITGIEETVGDPHRMGYPYNVIPYKKVAGITAPNGTYTSKPNFSGSGKSQINVIGGVSGHGFATGAGGGTLY